jgi:uncharacterized protein (UPF0305 family)
MRKRKFLQTDFIKFILEKYSEGQGLPDDEVEVPDEEGTELRKKKVRKLNEFEDEEEPIEDEEDDDEIIDELLNEYKRLKRKYESKSNRIHIRRKR